MRIVHISTADVGGAGSAALRLHKGLLEAGVDSKFICLYKKSFEEQVYEYHTKLTFNFFQRIFQKFGLVQTKEKVNEKELKKYTGDYEMFTFPYSDFNLLDVSIVKEADIINLHWVAEYLDYPTFFRGINKPIIWTLHDKNPTLGGFHLLLDKDKNPSFFKLEDELSEKKHAILNSQQNLSVVAPSKFLLNYSKESKNLGKFQHHHIPNSIDKYIFKPANQKLAREVFNIPNDKKIILFLDSPCFHKGADLIFECINLYKYKDVQFVALGCGYTEKLDGVINIVQISDERLMSLLYSAADLFLLPSREDNLPNMMLESLACGTPVLGFPTGGICDVIENGFNGWITEDLTVKALDNGINNFLNNIDQFNRDAIRNFMLENFDIKVQAKRYFFLYQSIFNK